MTARLTYRQWVRRILFFFPLQLLLLHFKKNHLLLLVWLLLFGYITQGIGVKYGIPNLFLYPEYFGSVGFVSFAITGFALGGFITAFNLYTYTMHGYRFPFIATIARPFLKFNVNNGVIPGLFILTYLICSANYQHSKELVPMGSIVLHLAGLLIGMFSFLAIALLYFTRTNTDIIKLLGNEPDEYRPQEPLMDIIAPTHDAPPARRPERRKAYRWLKRQQRTEKWRVETYLSPRLRIMLARSSAHYDQEMLRDILWQNHINGSIFELVLVLSFVALGAFSDIPFFSIPAGASVFLFLTMVLMLFSALFSWLQGWTGTIVITVIVLLNILSHHTDRFLADAQVYGLDYRAEPATYDQPTIYAMATDDAQASADATAVRATLDRWQARNVGFVGDAQKPVMVIINTSGGGLRAMLWTMHCLQEVDSLLDGSLMQRSTLMTGSSGGLIGAAYYRQLYLADEKQGTRTRQKPELLDEVADDMLNNLTFSFVTNDMFVRYRKVHDGDLTYTRDRGKTFEERLNANTRGMLDIRLNELAEPEREGRVPHLVISPTSINDGRRVIIASRPMSFLTNITPARSTTSVGQPEAIEFQRFFAAHDPGNLKLTSALRMNASFPYITPMVTLPSEPPMRVMDAGVRDNYGYRTTLDFLFTFREWIATHTGGVMILQLRDTQKELEVHPSSASLVGRFFDPVGSVYDNFVRVQDQDYDLMLKQASGWMPVPLEVIDLQLRHNDEEQISLSWHLTALERARVLRSLSSPENKAALQRLQEVLQVRPDAPSHGGIPPVLVADPALRP